MAIPLPMGDCQERVRKQSTAGTGYTKAPNDILDCMMRKMNPYQVKIALLIMRQTYGWQREWTEPISYRQLGEALNADKSQIMRHLKSGLEAGFFACIKQKTSCRYRLVTEQTNRAEKNTSTKQGEPSPQKEAENIQHCTRSAYNTVRGERTNLYAESVQTPQDLKKKKKEKEKTTAGASSSLSQKFDKKNAKAQEILSALPLRPDQIETLVNRFDIETLKRGVEWAKTAKYNDLGAALYKACECNWIPKSTAESRFKENQTWAKKHLLPLENRIFRRHKLVVCNKYIDFMPEGGMGQSVIIPYEDREFRERVEKFLGV